MSVLGATDRVVVVGASLAGLRAAEELRRKGFEGPLTLIDAEDAEPYDRPPLSKQVLLGMAPADRTRLPRLRDLGKTEWVLGVAAAGLDRARGVVELADGRAVPYDRLVIATGVRNRPWPVESEAGLDGVVSIRTGADAAKLAALLRAGPKRVVVIGAGFTGSEIASVCRQLDLPVTLAERGPAPLAGALGGVVGQVATEIQLAHGVDLRCGVTVEGLEGDDQGRLRRATLSDGTQLDVEVAVVALGALRNTEWLYDSRLAAGPRGVSTDAGCRAIDIDGLVVDDIFVAGDVSRFPHPLYEYQFLMLEHWENAVTQARIAAHNMMSPTMERLPHVSVPTFWSMQFGLNIKSVGVPNFGEEIQFTQGSVTERSFCAAYGHNGRLVAAVTVDNAKWLDFYRTQIEQAAPFPGDLHGIDGPATASAVPADFPHPSVPYALPPVVLTGHEPSQRHAAMLRPEAAPS
jgi:NADPH-dependent 2,4-dienoyl-CoA reductase/sulfur reductase-like enzyme